MRSNLNVKYDAEKRNFYIFKDNKKIYVNFKTLDNNSYLIPVSNKIKPIKFYNYDNVLKKVDTIYDNIVKEKDEIEPYKKLNQCGGSKLEELLENRTIGDLNNKNKINKRNAAIKKSKNLKKYLEADTEKKVNSVNYKIYTNPDVVISDTDYKKIKTIISKSIIKRIYQKFFDETDDISLDSQIKIIFSSLKNIPINNQQGGSSVSSDSSIKENNKPNKDFLYTKTGPQVGSKYFVVNIKGPYKYVNENIFNEKTTISLNSSKFNNGNPIKFFISYVRNSKLQKLFDDWDNSDTKSGRIVDRYIGEEQKGTRKARFSRSVNYLKNITERLRDCNDISIAYEKKHKEVEAMIVTIRKLYNLILFLRDQITKNQDNYDTLERLILEIMIAMKQDYHIPEGELERLKIIQKRIADDGVELEKKFRIVSNQILDRLKMSDSLKEESPDHIGPDFPIKPDLKFEDKTSNELEEAKKKVNPYNYIINGEEDDKDESDFTQYFKKKENEYGVFQSTGEPYEEDPDPFKYTDPNYEKGDYGKFSRSNEAKNQLESDDITMNTYNQQLNDVHDKASKELKKKIKKSNERFLNNEMETHAKKYKEQLGNDFLVDLKNESDDDSDRLVKGITIERKNKQKQDNKKMTKSMDDKENLVDLETDDTSSFSNSNTTNSSLTDSSTTDSSMSNSNTTNSSITDSNTSQTGGYKRLSKKKRRYLKTQDYINKYKKSLSQKKINQYSKTKQLIDNYKNLLSKNKLL